MGKIIAVTNQKGGVGKTTTAVSLAVGLKKIGFKTLLIDTDAQKNSTDTYRAETEGVCTLYDLLFEKGTNINECIQKTDAGDIIASDGLLREAEQRFPNDNSRFYVLKEKVEPLKELYDYIIIDTPPTIGVILSNVFTMADSLIVPLTCDRYGLAGINELYQSINSAKKYTNPGIKVEGLLLIKYHENQELAKEVSKQLPQVAELFDTKVFDVKIRECVSCPKSQSARVPIYDYDKYCTTSRDYENLCKIISNS